MRAKLSPAIRRAAKPKAALPAPAQTAAERRTADAATRALIKSMAPASTGVLAGMRRILRKRLATAHEIVYEYRNWFVISYSPTTHGFEGVLAIRGDATAVKLYFNRGKSLPDPDKLLQGSGTQARFVVVERASALNRPAVGRLLDLAIANTPAKFVAEGKGAVLIRSASL